MKKILKGSDLRRRESLADKVKTSSISTTDIFMDEGGGVINKKVLDAKGRAQHVIEEAKEAAVNIRVEAEGVLSQVKVEMERAKEQGFEEGRDEGLAQATERLVQLETIKEKFYDGAEPQVIKLVMTIAEKVIGKIVQDNTDAIKSIVKQALESALGEKIVIRLNPDDHKGILASEAEYREILDKTKRIYFKEDESITQGGCIVETEVGTIDARLETQLKAIRKALEL